MEKKKTQKEMVLEHLQNRGSITPLEALNIYGCFRLADVIYKLKKDGWHIRTEMVETLGGKTFAKYRLVVD